MQPEWKHLTDDQRQELFELAQHLITGANTILDYINPGVDPKRDRPPKLSLEMVLLGVVKCADDAHRIVSGHAVVDDDLLVAAVRRAAGVPQGRWRES